MFVPNGLLPNMELGGTALMWRYLLGGFPNVPLPESCFDATLRPPNSPPLDWEHEAFVDMALGLLDAPLSESCFGMALRLPNAHRQT